MNANLNIVAEELFGKIRTRFPQIQLGDESGAVIANNKDIGNARFFEFDYMKEGVSLGSVSIELSEEDGMTVMYSNDIAEGQPQNLVNEWYGFLKSLREFAGKRLLKFNPRDIAKSNLDKRDYGFLAKNSGEGQMTESKLRGTNRTSFQDVGEAKIIVRHSQNVNYDNPAGRTLHIESIFIENANGERFLYPHKHLNGARALAQHVAHGGTPYDAIGEHVIGLSEELSKLRFFKGYVSRQEQVSEAMGSVTDKVIERIDQVKKEIHQLQSSTHYNSFVESFKQSEAQQIPEDTVNDWVDKLTIRNFNEALKDVFPYIYKLVGETPVKELNADDLLDEVTDTVEKDKDGNVISWKHEGDWKKSTTPKDGRGRVTNLSDKARRETEKMSKVKEFAEFESTLDHIVSEDDGLTSSDEEVQNAAIEKLNALLAQNLKVGQDGTNAKMSLKDLIDDNEFMKVLDNVPAETDLNDLIKGWVETNHEDLVDKLTFPEGDATEPAPAPEPAAAEAPPAEAPAAPAAPEQPAAAPVAEDEEDMQQRKPAGAREIVEFVKSFYDRETGNFPKGETGVCIATEKEFGEGAGNVAKQVIERIHSIAEEIRMKKMGEISGHSELGRISELAGTSSAPTTTAMDRVREKAQSRQGSNFSESADLTAMLRIAGLR